MGAFPTYGPREVGSFLLARLDGVFLVRISQLGQSLMARRFTQAAQLPPHLDIKAQTPRPASCSSSSLGHLAPT